MINNCLGIGPTHEHCLPSQSLRHTKASPLLVDLHPPTQQIDPYAAVHDTLGSRDSAFNALLQLDSFPADPSTVPTPFLWAEPFLPQPCCRRGLCEVKDGVVRTLPQPEYSFDRVDRSS